MSHDPGPTPLQLAIVLCRRWIIASLVLGPAIVASWLFAGLTAGPNRWSELRFTAPGYGIIWAGVSLFGGLVAVAMFGVLRNGVALKPKDLRPINRRFAFAFSAGLLGVSMVAVALGRLIGMDMHDLGAAPVGGLVVWMTGVMMADRFTPYRKSLVGEAPR